MELNETLRNVLVIAAHAIGTKLLQVTAATPSRTTPPTTSIRSSSSSSLASSSLAAWLHVMDAAEPLTMTTTAMPATTSTATTTIPTVMSTSDAEGPQDAVNRLLGVDAAADAVTLVANLYDKLLQPSLMNTFNVSLEYIESTTQPDAALAANDTSGGGGNIGGFADGDVVGPLGIAAIVALLCKCVIMSFIILAAIFGNMLVIVSVMQHRRLR